MHVRVYNTTAGGLGSSESEADEWVDILDWKLVRPIMNNSLGDDDRLPHGGRLKLASFPGPHAKHRSGPGDTWQIPVCAELSSLDFG